MSPGNRPVARPVKCVVWDLDNTLWDGVLLEDPQVRPRPALAAAIRELDAEGVLHSIASRNDPERALAALHAMQLDELFLCPQIGWQPKSQAVRRVSEELGVAADSIAFVDDDPFERAEVETALPEIRCFEPYQLADPAVRGALRPAVVTSDARQRRSLYRAELERRSAEETFDGPSAAFLATLEMRFRIARATADDLLRVAELLTRTNQFNATGYFYSLEELQRMLDSSEHLVLVASLTDRFGDYGRVGVALVELGPHVWTLKLLLVSCRVLSRGASTEVRH